MNKWIETANRIPSNEREVLVYDGVHYFLAHLSHGDSWKISDMSCALKEFKWWIPLPDPPELIEIKHAHLIKREFKEAGIVLWECSRCGYTTGANRTNYCPNCGAKID